MRHLLFLILCGFLFSNCSVIRTKDRGVVTKVKETMFAARKENEVRKRVLVLPFLNASSYPSQDVAKKAENYFIEKLKSTDHVVMVNRLDFGLNDTESFEKGGGYDYDKMAKHLRNSGVHIIVSGRIDDLRTGKKGDSVGLFRRVEAEVKAKAHIEVVSVRSGKVMVETTKTADISEHITRVAEKSYADNVLKDDPYTVNSVVYMAFSKCVPAVIESLQKFSWEARVALVRGESVYLNSGRISGLQIGDLLRVVEPEDEVFDPQTNKFIGYIKGRMKGTVEVMNYYGTDGAITRVHSGSGFKENDLVEFY